MNILWLLLSLTLIMSSTNMMFGVPDSWEVLLSCRPPSENNPQTIVPVSFPLNIPGTGVLVGDEPKSIAITPDRTKALVANNSNGTISVLDLTQEPFVLLDTVPITSPYIIAITPNGTKALVTSSTTGRVTVFAITEDSISEIDEILVGQLNKNAGIAITPDGSKALVSESSGTIYILNLADPITVSGSISHSPNAFRNIAITPDGNKAIVIDFWLCNFSVINLASNPIQWLQNDVSLNRSEPLSLAITPDGTKAFITTFPSPPSPFGPSFKVLDLTQDQIIVVNEPVPVNDHGGGQIAITPDSKRALMTFPGMPVTTYCVFDITQNPITLEYSWDKTKLSAPIAITPDQAPTSLFSFVVNGATVDFDASSSFSPVGDVKTYRWDFGDGITEETSIPTTSHSYLGFGVYTVSLTVVNDAGTSTEITFTGQMVSNNGMPRAQSAQLVSINPPPPPPSPPSPPSKFKGKARFHCKHTHAFLKTKWKKSPSVNAQRYEIFARHTIIATIQANCRLYKKIKLHPKYNHHHLSQKYRDYLQKKYKIRVVDTSGLASSFLPVHVYGKKE